LNVTAGITTAAVMGRGGAGGSTGGKGGVMNISFAVTNGDVLHIQVGCDGDNGGKGWANGGTASAGKGGGASVVCKGVCAVATVMAIGGGAGGAGQGSGWAGVSDGADGNTATTTSQVGVAYGAGTTSFAYAAPKAGTAGGASFPLYGGGGGGGVKGGGGGAAGSGTGGGGGGSWYRSTATFSSCGTGTAINNGQVQITLS
jgi:hypothetical protein